VVFTIRDAANNLVPNIMASVENQNIPINETGQFLVHTELEVVKVQLMFEGFVFYTNFFITNFSQYQIQVKPITKLHLVNCG